MRRLLIVVAARDRDRANAACEAAGLGPDTFSVGLVPAAASPASPPPTHYWCCTTYDDTLAALDAAGISYRVAPDSRGVRLEPGPVRTLGAKDPEEFLKAEALQRLQPARLA